MQATVLTVALTFLMTILLGISPMQAAENATSESERAIQNCPDQVGFTQNVVEQRHFQTSHGLQGVQTTQVTTRVEGGVGVGFAKIGPVTIPIITLNLGGPCIGYKDTVQEFIKNRDKKLE